MVLRWVRQFADRLLYRLQTRSFQQKVIRAAAGCVAVVLSFGLAIWFDASMWQRNIAAFFGAILVFLIGAVFRRSL